jgi:GNAT superfamily N-acetyltransferase
MNVRPISPEDAPAVAALARADEEVLRGRPSHLVADEVAAWWERTDLPNDSWLFEENGDVVAAGWFQMWGDIGSHGGIVAQGAKGRGLGASLVDRAEAAGARRGAPRMHAFALGDDPAAAELFGSRGYHEVRRFWEMAIDLDAEPVVPVLPEPLLLDEFRDGDERAFHHATTESFQDHWEWYGMPFEEWWEMRRANDHSLWFVVRDGDEIAAVARNEARETSGYVGLLGVRRPWRGRGLGKVLLYRTFAEFWHRGLRRVTLGVDAASPTGATKLYERVGMHVEAENVVFEKAAM